MPRTACAAVTGSLRAGAEPLEWGRIVSARRGPGTNTSEAPGRAEGTVSLLVVGGRTRYPGLPADVDTVIAAALARRLGEASPAAAVSGVLDLPADLDDHAFASTVLGAIGHLSARGHRRILLVNADPRGGEPLNRLSTLEMPGAVVEVLHATASWAPAAVPMRRSVVAAGTAVRTPRTRIGGWLHAHLFRTPAARGEQLLRALVRDARPVLTALLHRPLPPVSSAATAECTRPRSARRQPALTFPGPRLH